MTQHTTESPASTGNKGDVIAAFMGITYAQKQGQGSPFSIRRDFSRLMGGGVFPYVIEHATELLYIMTHGVATDAFYPDLVLAKVKSILSTLEYNFWATHQENLTNNAEYKGCDRHSLEMDGDILLRQLAIRQSRITVYNEPQFLAREVVVALAKKQYKIAEVHLRTLRSMISASAPSFSAVAKHVYRHEGRILSYEERHVNHSLETA